MKPSAKFDNSSFSRKFQEYAALNKRDQADLANAKLLQLAFKAQELTEKADSSKIAQVATKPWWPKFISKQMRGRVVGNRKGAYHRAAKQLSRRFLASRKKGAGFLKSGYLPAIRRLLPIVKDRSLSRPNAFGGAKQYGQDKGSVMPAKPGDFVYAEISNSAKGITKKGAEAMEQAKQFVMADMDKYIARKMQERIDQHFR